MDETTSIGVIELKTCIQAIVECSPELVARLGQDYTVYAYDYSEYDNPLVGQGMLSWALAAASPNPDVPAHQSQKLITGRVCKNILGLFANGVKETLEVKLRLVAVPSVLQSEYLNTMEKYRELSKVIPAGFDHSEWTAFLQSNPNVTQMANKLAAPVNSASNQRDGMSMEVVNQLLSPSLHQQPSMDAFNQINNAENSGNETQGGASNVGKGQKTSRPSSRASIKRPRAKPRPRKNTASIGGNTSGYEEGTDGDDGPAPKKRAKITKTDWNSKSSFGSASDSLRVAASTAGSLRLFRPIAMSPAPTTGSHLQEIPRAPTPVPMMSMPNQHVARDGAPSQTGLRRDSFLSQVTAPREHVSPYPPVQNIEDQVRFSIESAGPSPERNSPADTPPDIGSSPPVMRTVSPLHSSPGCPSSPDLPEMPRTDSGFMSGSLEELFGGDDEAMRPIEDEDLEVLAKYSRRRGPRQAPPLAETHYGFEIEEEIPGPVELLPTRMPVIAPPKPSKAASKQPRSRAGSVMSEDGQILPPLKGGSRAPSRGPATSQPEMGVQALQPPPPLQTDSSGLLPEIGPIPFEQLCSQPPETPQVLVDAYHPPLQPQSRPGSRMMVRTASMGSLTLPIVAASDPTLPPSNLHRSQTWSEAPHPATEAPTPMNPSNGIPYSRTTNAKKASIKQKLELAIANGEMPPFCCNCGAIETPTWRKAWSQEIQGAPGYHEYSDEPGRVTAIIILGRDHEGNPTSYQLIKKFLLPEENHNDFKEFILCNRKFSFAKVLNMVLTASACGIWMSKYKTQRPEERWECNRPPKSALDKSAPLRKRPSQRPSRAKKPQTSNAMNPTSEANFPQSEANFPQSEAYQFHSEAIGPLEGVSPTDTTSMLQQQAPPEERTQAPDERRRSTSIRPVKRLNAMTSDAASAALRRAIQSSPARWAGTRQSPIDVEEGELDPTRRLLFPSPRKDGSPKVLGEITTNVVQIATDFRSPKDQNMEAPNKENYPPAFTECDGDTELLKLFEEEMTRPKTPVQKSTASNPFKTPTRPTPSHRPITRSVTKSIRSGKSPRSLMLSQRTPSRTPSSSARRRSPRNHQAIFESPFTATLNQLMSEANNHHSPTRQGLELDFGNLSDLPDLSHTTHQGDQAEMNFNLQDFFSTDVPMPSSPPKMFHLYEDPMTMGNINWDEFNTFDAKLVGNDGKENDETQEVEVKVEPASPKDCGDDDDDAVNLVDSSKLD